MAKKLNKLWVEKYRPITFDGYIFQDDAQRAKFEEYIVKKEIPHLLMMGVQGSGKTTMAGILVNLLEIDEMDILQINGSDNNSVDYIRETISSFAQTYAMGKFKIVWIDEFDYVTINAQAALRVLMEQCSDNCRFILTCNYANKVIPAIKSRVQEYTFKAPDKEAVFMRAVEILETEKIEWDLDTLAKFVDSTYPDVRKLIGMLQQYSVTSKLETPEGVNAGDVNFQLLDLLTAGDLKGLRKAVIDNVAREEFEGIYTFLYQNLHRVPVFVNVDIYEAAVLQVGAYLYKNNLVADQELNFHCLMIELNNLTKP